MAVDGLNVIFDLGGVLIDWNPRYLYRHMFADAEAAMERFLAEVCTGDWNTSLDAGKPFAEGVAELVAIHPHERERIKAWHGRWIEMLAGPITGTVEILEELAAREVPLYALTNWSAETFALVRPDTTYAFLDRFRTIFVSGELRMIKPDPALFRHVLEAIGTPPERCLFIDDSAKNIDAAARLGIRTHHFTTPESLRQDLTRLGLVGHG